MLKKKYLVIMAIITAIILILLIKGCFSEKYFYGTIELDTGRVIKFEQCDILIDQENITLVYKENNTNSVIKKKEVRILKMERI